MSNLDLGYYLQGLTHHLAKGQNKYTLYFIKEKVIYKLELGVTQAFQDVIVTFIKFIEKTMV